MTQCKNGSLSPPLSRPLHPAALSSSLSSPLPRPPLPFSFRSLPTTQTPYLDAPEPGLDESRALWLPHKANLWQQPNVLLQLLQQPRFVATVVHKHNLLQQLRRRAVGYNSGGEEGHVARIRRQGRKKKERKRERGWKDGTMSARARSRSLSLSLASMLTHRLRMECTLRMSGDHASL